MVFLEFEQPLEKLYEQLEKIQQIGAEGDIDVSDKINELETKIKSKHHNKYSHRLLSIITAMTILIEM